MTLLAALLILAAACSGGGDSDDDSATVEDVAADIGGSGLAASFTADQPNPGSNTVAMSASGSTEDAVTVGVRVTDTSDVHTAAFDIVFDPAAVDFLGFSAGALLEQGGNTPVYQVAEQSGRVVVGISRSGTDGTNAVGSTTSIDLIFQVLQAGSHTISMENTSLLDSDLDVIPGMAWFGGTAVGN